MTLYTVLNVPVLRLLSISVCKLSATSAKFGKRMHAHACMHVYIFCTLNLILKPLSVTVQLCAVITVAPLPRAITQLHAALRSCTVV